MRLEPLARLLCRRYAELKATPTRRSADGPVDSMYYTRICRFQLTAQRLVEAGVVIRDPEQGWFELAAQRDGQPIRLSWKLGQPIVPQSPA